MSIEFKLIAWAAVLVGLIGGGAIWHHAIYEDGDVAGSTRVQALWNTDTQIRDQEWATAQAKAIAAQKAQDAVVQQAQVDHAKLQADNARLSHSLADSVRNLESAFLRLNTVPGAMGHPGEPAGDRTDAGSDPELADSVGRVDAAFKEETDGALVNFANLTAILAIAPKAIP